MSVPHLRSSIEVQRRLSLASIIGKGVLKPYSQTVEILKPVPVTCLPELMKLPEEYHENIIAVRDGKVLSLDELMSDEDEITVFITVMGG